MINYKNNLDFKNSIKQLNHREKVTIGLILTKSYSCNKDYNGIIKVAEAWLIGNVINMEGMASNLKNIILNYESNQCLYNIGKNYSNTIENSKKVVDCFFAKTNYKNKDWNNFIND